MDPFVRPASGCRKGSTEARKRSHPVYHPTKVRATSARPCSVGSFRTNKLSLELCFRTHQCPFSSVLRMTDQCGTRPEIRVKQSSRNTMDEVKTAFQQPSDVSWPVQYPIQSGRHRSPVVQNSPPDSITKHISESNRQPRSHRAVGTNVCRNRAASKR